LERLLKSQNLKLAEENEIKVLISLFMFTSKFKAGNGNILKWFSTDSSGYSVFQTKVLVRAFKMY
jgi:hypothetical protein